MLARDILVGSLLQELVLVTLALGIVWFGVRRGLRPLHRLSDTVAHRGTQLDAIEQKDLPAEMKPLVQALYLSPVAKVKPEGKLSLAGGMFGKSNIPARFAAYVARRLDHGKRWRVIVGHCDAHADGTQTLQAMRALLDCEQGWLVETGPAVGAHAGPGALVISVQACEEPTG